VAAVLGEKGGRMDQTQWMNHWTTALRKTRHLRATECRGALLVHGIEAAIISVILSDKGDKHRLYNFL